MNPCQAPEHRRVWRGFSSIWGWIRRSHPYRTYSRFVDVGGPVLSAGMSFQAVFAIFAALAVGFGILALSARNNEAFTQTISELINTYVPGLIETAEQEGEIALGELLRQRTIDLSSIIAGISLVWISMAWFTSTRRSVRIVFGLEVKEYRNWMLLKLRDFFGAIVFFIAILVSAALTVVSSSLFREVLTWFGVDDSNWFIGTLGSMSSYALMFVVDVCIIIGIHRFLAEVRVPFWPLVQGAMIGAALLFGLKMLANAVFGNLGANQLLATFAFFAALLLWFNLICRVLLLASSWIATGQDKTLGLPEKGPLAAGWLE